MKTIHEFILSSVFVLSAFICFPTEGASFSTAEDKLSDIEILTEKEAIRLVLERSEKQKFLETDVDIAEYRLETNECIENPEIRLSQVLEQDNKSNYDEFALGLRWKPARYGELEEEKLKDSVDLADKKIEALRYKHRLINKVRKRFADVILFDDLIEVTQSRVESESRRLEIVEKMVELGQRSIVYLTKSKMWLAEAKHDYTRNLKQQKEYRTKLSRLTGTSETIKVKSDDPEPVTENIERLTEIACQNRPEIAQAQIQTQLAIQKGKVERSKIIPRPTYFDLTYHFEQEKDDRMEFMMGIEVPFFNWNRGNIKAMSLAVGRKQDELSAVQEQIKDEVSDAYSLYGECLHDWEGFARDLSDIIDQTDLIKKQTGEYSILPTDEILELDRVILETRKLLSEKRHRLAYATFDLLYVLGVEKLTSSDE